MAIREIIESDLSGKADAATVTFGLGDTWYEVDLTDEEQKDLRQALQLYVKAGREAPHPGNPKRKVPPTTREERAAIRAWGKKQGLEFAARGKIPKDVQEAYDKAHNIDRDV